MKIKTTTIDFGKIIAHIERKIKKQKGNSFDLLVIDANLAILQIGFDIDNKRDDEPLAILRDLRLKVKKYLTDPEVAEIEQIESEIKRLKRRN